MSDKQETGAIVQFRAEIRALRDELADLRTHFYILAKRQVLQIDEGMLAIRHDLGWIVVPQEDYALIVHLGNGVSGHESGTLKVMQQFVRKGDTVIDLGAHIGLHSIPLARAVGPTGRLIAVEPLPRTAECLRRSLICNDLLHQSVVLIAAASDINGQAHFYLGANSMLGSLYPAVNNQIPIDVREVVIDDAVGSEVRIDFVKMDVEGAELRALAGMYSLIARNPDIGLIAEFGASHLERVGINPKDWFEAFAATGLSAAFMIDEADGSLSPVDMQRITRMYSVNVLFVKDPQRVVDIGTARVGSEAQ